MALLRAVRLNPGISRVRLADQLGLTRPTIGNLVDELLNSGWLVEERLGPTGSLGRRPVALHVNNENRVVIGSDINAQRSICLVATLDGEIRNSRVIPNESGDVKQVLATLARQTFDLWQDLRSKGLQVSGMAIGVPGTVSESTGVLYNSESTGWKNIPIYDIVKKNLNNLGVSDLPIHVQRAADCVALYHFEYHCHAEEEPLLYVHVGHNVTSAIATRYALLQGNSGTMGSVGHFILEPNGVECHCGRRGCANVQATLHAVQRATGKTYREIALLEKADNSAIIHELQRAGRYFGTLLYNLSMQFDPARLLVGGQAIESGQVFLEAAQSTFMELRSFGSKPELTMETVRHDTNATALGAVTSMLYTLISPPYPATSRPLSTQID